MEYPTANLMFGGALIPLRVSCQRWFTAMMTSGGDACQSPLAALRPACQHSSAPPATRRRLVIMSCPGLMISQGLQTKSLLLVFSFACLGCMRALQLHGLTCTAGLAGWVVYLTLQNLEAALSCRRRAAEAQEAAVPHGHRGRRAAAGAVHGRRALQRAVGWPRLPCPGAPVAGARGPSRAGAHGAL